MRSYPPFATMSQSVQTGVVKDIFTTSHGRYDFLNHFLSLRRDVAWRRFTVEKMRFPRQGRFLDVATGTADLALEAARRHPLLRVVGIDFVEPMLGVGRKKVQASGMADRITLQAADALHLPFEDRSFDVTAVAFGMRNIPDKLAAVREMARVTVPGGQVMVLEMTFAPAGAFRAIYRFYLTRVLPRLAGLFARNAGAYAYLADSIQGFPSPPSFRELMISAGLADVVYYGLTFGTAYVHIGRVPLSGGASS
ncbi:MAG TPA: ubiquinone/menaquinone biosynthesis methyltransferase [Spirochaetia bacterium]|nr:ubiquinone/menaquinone biosynthesis methyltransferase [Spirochaetia bacterium]